MLSQYLYISTAPNLSRGDVDSILEASARPKPARGLSGLRLFSGRNFLPLIEGEESALVALMVRIGNDPRHTGVSILERRAIEQRACPGWAMKRVLIAESIAGRRDQLERDLPADLDEQTRRIILNFAILN
ncbi:MAG: BLUF domain-containing protein [Erythrobacter sp.]